MQNGCFPTARLAQAASREILLVRCCVPATVLRAKRRCSARRALLRLELRLPRTLSFETPPHQPRFARLACAAAFKIGAQAGSPLTVAAWARSHAQQAILAHLDQPFRRRVHADHQWLLEMFKLVRQPIPGTMQLCDACCSNNRRNCSPGVTSLST